MNKPVDNFTLTIRGMRCGSCVAHVRKALMEATGVESATVAGAGARLIEQQSSGLLR